MARSLDKAPAAPGSAQDDIGYLRGERRTLIIASSLGFLLFIIVTLCFPNAGPVFRILSIGHHGMAPAVPVWSNVVVSRASYGYSRYSFDDFELPISSRWPALVPRRGDIVAYRMPSLRVFFPKENLPPPIDLFASNPTIFMSRIIGLPGDKIEMTNDRLSINGKLVQREPAPKMPDPDGGIGEVDVYIERLPEGASYRVIERAGRSGPANGTLVYDVQPGEVFLLGDDRVSRYTGRHTGNLVPIELVIGRAIAAF